MLLNTYEPWKFAFSHECHDLNNCMEDSWGIIGVPFDSTSSYHTSSRLGPIVIREASFGFERYNTFFNTNLDTVFYDFGDLNVVPGNCIKTCEILEDAILEMSSKNIKPILIGGEHSISLSGVKSAIKKNKDLTVVHLDAHRDLAYDFIGEKCSHATVLRRIHELGVKELIQIGIRSSSKEEEDFVLNQDNITTFKANEVRRHIGNILYKLTKIDTPIYLTIDMDVFDPSIAPNVGNPTPAGLKINNVESIIEALSKKDIIGFDVVEVTSDKLGDPTAILASKLIYDFLSLVK